MREREKESILCIIFQLDRAHGRGPRGREKGGLASSERLATSELELGRVPGPQVNLDRPEAEESDQ